MLGPFFRKSSWPNFTFLGNTYPLGHLDEFEMQVLDSLGISRTIAVTFEDHCFTEKPCCPNPSLEYPGCSRNPGHFCFTRYELSLDLPRHIQAMATQKVWNAEGDRFLAVPLVNHQGYQGVYRIFFDLRRVRGLPVDLHLRVVTAHLGSSPSLQTYGSVRFPVLVSKIMRGERPKRITDRHRSRPRVT